MTTTIRELYRVCSADYCQDKDGNAVPLLTYDTDGCSPEEIVSTGGVDATLEELVELCDQNAEFCNAHNYCGAHRILGAVLYNHLGRSKATEIMLDIARHGGLDEMAGVFSAGAYEELGVGKNGHDWDGSYGK